MGDDPGKRLTGKDTQTIIIKLKGPIKKTDALQFKKDLDNLIKRFQSKAKGGIVERPVRG